ncbi:hypothetical protein KBW81_12885 [Loktanella salsilacus]|uniref:GIY-YIG nuclease family protein n=1 Tax=Loktanella salsilacus TaxID=195913 RepID=UPI0020B63AB7|nr:hypothetical protein [Loktanella salsilacus]UTH47600.1 hypothetical protein KBW81_12885 [Loktanella salsilacus]
MLQAINTPKTSAGRFSASWRAIKSSPVRSTSQIILQSTKISTENAKACYQSYREKRKYFITDAYTKALLQLTSPSSREEISENYRLENASNTAGLYAWFADSVAAEDLSIALNLRVPPGLVYAGQAGATRWPSGKIVTQTLKGRVEGNHIRGVRRSSTFRRTLDAIIAFESERHLTQWMQKHLSVAMFSHDDRSSLMSLEESVLAKLDPPFNLKGVPSTPIRTELALRRKLARTKWPGNPPVFNGVPP